MERLTARTEHGNAYIPECFSRCEGEGTSEKCRECEIEHKLVYSLAAYEDLGVSPEQLHEISDMYLDRCKEINRLRAELEELKKKMPLCKVGDTVFAIRYGEDKDFIIKETAIIEIRQNINGWFFAPLISGRSFNLGEFGKTVFLTKEAAEQALKQMGE